MTMFWNGAANEDTTKGVSLASTYDGEQSQNRHIRSEHVLQPWQGMERVLELNTNIRSGDDKWFSQVLDECRQGQLREANHNFFHASKLNFSQLVNRKR